MGCVHSQPEKERDRESSTECGESTDTSSRRRDKTSTSSRRRSSQSGRKPLHQLPMISLALRTDLAANGSLLRLARSRSMSSDQLEILLTNSTSLPSAAELMPLDDAPPSVTESIEVIAAMREKVLEDVITDFSFLVAAAPPLPREDESPLLHVPEE